MHIHIFSGETIERAVRRMLDVAVESSEEVTAEFNEIELVVQPGSDPDLVVQQYWTESNRRHEEWKRSPEGRRWERELNESAKRIRAFVKEPLREFGLKDPELWHAYVGKLDFMSAAIVRFAALWAHLMEQKIAQGLDLEDVASATSEEADIEAISGSMYGAAVLVLYEHWVHGDRLRLWHNLELDPGDRGERANEDGVVLDPSVIAIL